MKETARQINKEEYNYLLSLKEDDITMNLLKDFFAFKKNKQPKFQPFDKFVLEKGTYYNKEKITTTVGLFIFNKLILGEKLLPILGYKNDTFDGDGIDDLDDEMSRLLLENKIETPTFADYLDKCQWLGFGIAKFMNSSLTYNLLVPPNEVEKRKKELIESKKKELESGDIHAAADIESELIGLSKKILKDTPDIQIYDSGCRGSFGNNFKNTSLMRGAIKNLADPTQIKISTNSLVDGIPPEEFAQYADLITQASYSRAVGTQEGGYEAKKLSSGFQNACLGEAGSDCGSKKTITITLSNDNKNFFTYRYIKEGNKLVLLDPDNINDYLGKTVEMRSPMFCTHDHYCSKCAGELYYMLGIKNVGILTNRIGTRLLNLSLKAFHDLTLKLVDIDIDKYIE